jgi:hypothetical protein
MSPANRTLFTVAAVFGAANGFSLLAAAPPP